MAVLAVHERDKGVYWNNQTQLQDKILYKIDKLSLVKETQSAMEPQWPGHCFCQFEKHLAQPKIKCMCRIHLEIHFNLA